MAGLVDYQAVVVDLRAALLERASWGSAQIRERLDELEQRHRIDEATEARVLRHFGAHLTDTFMGLLPAPATPGPLATDDHSTSTAMDEGAPTDQPTEDECRPTPTPLLPHPLTRPSAAPVSLLADPCAATLISPLSAVATR